MSNISVSNQYSVYSNLISQTYSTGNTPSATTNSLLSMYSYIYGTNSTASSKVSEYLVDLKESANDTINSISDVKGAVSNTKNVSANSDTKAITADYTGKEKRDDIKIDVSSIATAQKNEGVDLKSNASSLYYSKSNDISITTADGKSYSFNYSASITEKNSSALSKIAQKINKADIGVSASVETDEKKGTSKLVLSGNSEGDGKDFSVSGGLAETLGINNVSVSAKDAEYSINGEKFFSSSNKIKVDDELTLNINDTTEKTATISFGKSKLSYINAARELVNSFNGLANTAYSYDDSGAEKLGNKLTGLAKTYSSSLSKIGVTLNSKGYLEIDEDKMNESAESGELNRFFESNGKDGLSYGFVNRLEDTANKAFKNPTDYLSKEGKQEVDALSSSYDLNSNLSVSSNYISAYYKYSSAALLFDMFG